MNGRESREKNCCWHFDKATGQYQGPNDASEMHFTGDPYPILVRESIQNSLDAVLDKTKPVKVKIEMGELEKNFYKNFFNLKQHIQSCIETYKEQAIRFEPMLEYFKDVDKNEKIGYLKVTDSNTTGMSYEEGNIKCPFYAFAFSSGLNSKENNDTSGGAYGFGKTAFFQLSRISTILVSSIYDDNNKTAFTGISRLCSHKLDGEMKTAVGYYGNIVQTEDGEKSVPVTQLEEIPKKFRLEERGTSVCVIGVDVSDKTKKKAINKMIEAVLGNYWLAIWEGKLEVDICENIINKSNLNEWMEQTFLSDYTKNAIHSNTYNPRPYFDAVRFAGQRDDCWLIQKNLTDIGKVDLYIMKTAVGNDYVVYMRGNLMFIFSKKRQSHYGYNALFVCRGDRGNKILKELENPSHNEWAEKYRIKKLNLDPESITGKLGKQVLEKIEDFIKETTEEIFHSGDNEILTIAGLEDYLYIPETLLADVSPKRNEDAISGNPAEGKQEDGSAPKTIIEGDAKIDEKEKREVGHIIITKSGKLLPNDKSNNVVGAGYEHKGGGPKPKGTRASGNFTQADVEPDDSSSFSKLIPVEYRIVALSRDGLVYHDIIFKSPVEAEHGAIEVLVGCEEQKEEIPQILHTNAGTIQGNYITNLHIKEGKNVVRIQLGDKLKHAIKLAAYENK